MARKDIHKDGESTQFSKDNQPQKRGRKPDKLKELARKHDYSKSDVKAMIQDILFGNKLGELEEIITDNEKRKELTAFTAYALKLLQVSTEKGDPRAFFSFLETVYGKPSQELSVSGSMSMSGNLTLSKEEEEQFESFMQTFSTTTKKTKRS